MISLPGTEWGCIGYLNMLGYEETRLPTSLQEMVLFKSLLDLSCLWGSLRQNIGRKIKCWMDNQHMAKSGEVLVVLRDRLEN
jgi:hypothetical protein